MLVGLIKDVEEEVVQKSDVVNAFELRILLRSLLLDRLVCLHEGDTIPVSTDTLRSGEKVIMEGLRYDEHLLSFFKSWISCPNSEGLGLGDCKCLDHQATEEEVISHFLAFRTIIGIVSRDFKEAVNKEINNRWADDIFIRIFPT